MKGNDWYSIVVKALKKMFMLMGMEKDIIRAYFGEETHKIKWSAGVS